MTLAIETDDTEPALDPLQALKSERAPLLAESARLGKVRARLNEAARAENEAVAALDELSEAEAAAMKVWASAGAVGATPQPKTEEREKLTARLAEASAQAAAARTTIGDVEGQEREIRDQLVRLHQKISFHAREILVREFETGLGEIQTIVDKANEKIGGVLGLKTWLSEAGRVAQIRNDAESASMFFALAERVAGLKTPTFGADKAEINAAGERWGKRYAELMAAGDGDR